MIRVRLLHLSLFLLVPLMVYSQLLNRDVVFLKNGSIIKCTILEMIPDSTIRIQIADKSVLVYSMSDVLKTSNESIPAEKTKMTIDSNTHAAFHTAFSVFGGVALPVGDFSKKGNANTGFMFGAQYVSSGKIGWLLSGSCSWNKMEFPSLLEENGINSETGDWTSIFVMTGVKLGISDLSDAQLFIAPLVGVLFGTIPEITITLSNRAYIDDPSYGLLYGSERGLNVSQSSGSNVAIAYGIALEAIINSKIVLGARYIASNPQYDVKDKIWGQGTTTYGQIVVISQPEQYNFQLKQSTSFVLIYLGVVL
jgi:hypothetical protein